MYNLFPQEKLSSSIKGSHHRTNFPNLNLFFRLNFSREFELIWLAYHVSFFLYTGSVRNGNLVILNLFENGPFSQN